MNFRKTALFAGLISSITPISHAFTINFDYSLDETNFFTAGTTESNLATSLLETAGNYFSTILEDTFDAVSFSTDITLPSSSTTHTSQSVTSAQDALTIYVGGVALGGGTLGQAGPAWSNSVNSRGETGHTGSSLTATDFAPLYGRMSFDSDRSNWYFDSDLSTDGDINGFDFYSVALHEIGHVLGFGLAPSFDALVTGNEFTGTNAVAVNGGNVDLYSDNGHLEIGLTSTIAGLGSFETAMDPNISANTRKLFTDLDLAILEDIGWELAPGVGAPSAVPVPAAVWLFGSGLFALLGFRRRA